MNTTQRSSIILACGFALCALPQAHADTHAEKHVKLMDANGDGKVSRAEHAAGAKKMFQQCDASRDGIVTAAEMDAAMAKQGTPAAEDDKSSAEKIRVIDQNGD